MSSVDAAIEDLYTAFASEAKPRKITACPCCVSSDDVCTLLNTPLRSLGCEQLSGYASAVLLTSGSEDDLRYFFPRMLDLAIRDRYSWPDREIVLGKLRLGNWKLWSRRQQAAIIRAVRAAFESELRRGKDRMWNVDSWLCSLALAEADVQPFLDALSEPGNEEALYEYYELNSTHLRKGKLWNSFWDGKRAEQKPILAWFQSERVRDTVARIHQLRYGAP